MRVVVVGGGKVGSYLASQLLQTGKSVTVIEADQRRAADLAEATKALVIEGDGTAIAVLESANIDRADWLVAVTGLDEVNLVACELGVTLGVGRTLARLNDPRNRRAFTALGISVVSVTDLIGEVIEHQVDVDRFERSLLVGGALSLIEVEIPFDAPPRIVEDMILPGDTIIGAIMRDGVISVPGGDAMIQPGDRVLALTLLDHEVEVRRSLRGGDS